MANLELTKVEERPGGQLLFNIRATVNAGEMVFPIAIKSQGSASLNETMVLHSALEFAEELESAIRLRLGVEQPEI
ncbi:hypothetical protein [Rhizobium sp. Root1220]|uniref:hypothetical protein n=1 Tax=Rhizobium sp. Root1220 TaxID=1736432 RepID=UPI0006FF8768|nr:hypothetical protein [Rhizobium sp. Root1220]KQV79254.1 hypothetical protein ASC90_26405 [Rhizobium sp. Root1220]